MIEILIVITFLLLVYVVLNERYKKRLEDELDKLHVDMDTIFKAHNNLVTSIVVVNDEIQE